MTLRGVLATTGGMTFLAAWIAGAMVIGDKAQHLHPALAFLYYATAGIAWVFPICWLMIWAARPR